MADNHSKNSWSCAFIAVKNCLSLGQIKWIIEEDYVRPFISKSQLYTCLLEIVTKIHHK